MPRENLNEDQKKYLADSSQKELLYDIAQILFLLKEDVKQIKELTHAKEN